MNFRSPKITVAISTNDFDRISSSAKNKFSLSAGAKDYFKNPLKQLISFLAKALGWDHVDSYTMTDQVLEEFSRDVKHACKNAINHSTSGIFQLKDRNGVPHQYQIEQYQHQHDFGIHLVKLLPGSTYGDEPIYTKSGVTLQHYINAPD